MTLDLINLTVSRSHLFNCNFFTFTFNMLTALDEFIEVLAALAADLGIDTKTCQPDRAGVAFNVTEDSRLNIDFFRSITLAMVHLTSIRAGIGPQELRA